MIFQPMDYPFLFRLAMNIWPPFLGSGIRVVRIAPDWRFIRVEMGYRWYNRNYVKSHFGGNLFAMTDPFYMLMLMRNLGSGYIVWDSESAIRFRRPGRSRVGAEFILSKERLAEIGEKAAGGGRLREPFKVAVIDDRGAMIASVEKTIYIRKKPTAEDSDVQGWSS